MSLTHQQLDEMMVAAWQLPFGPSATAAAEEVIQHADANMWPDLQYAGRILATRCYQYGAEPSKAFVTFSWCLNAYDRGEADPRFDHQLFWYFKWMVGSLTTFPEVPLDRARAVLDDMERRYKIAGHGMNAVHQRREMLARHIGDMDTAREQYRLWNASARDAMSDCERCEPGAKVNHLVRLGRYEEAIEVAQPGLVSDGDCSEQPQGILTNLLVAYLRTGRLEEAVDAHRRAYRAMQHDRGELHAIGSHLRFCALTGNHSRGLELLERHIGWLEEPPTPMAEMWFAGAAANLLARLVDAGYDDITVRRPGGEVEVRDLLPELAARAREIAARFDARNGTGEQGERVRELIEAEPIVEYLPLSGVARRAELLEEVESSTPAAGVVESIVDPVELADLAELEFLRDNDSVSAEAWERFDELCPEPNSLLLARRVTGLGAHAAGEEPEEAERHWLRALELFTEAGEEALALAVRSRIGMIRCLLGRPDDGLPMITDAVDRLGELGEAEQQVRALSRLASAYQTQNRVDEAWETLTRARELVEPTGDTELTADVVLAMVPLLVQRQDIGAALALAERAISLYSTVPGTNRLRQAQFMAANLRAGAGEFDVADGLLAEAAHSTSPVLRAAALHTRGRVAMDQNRFEHATEHLTDAVAVFSNAGEPVHAAHVRVDLAAAALNNERFSDAADAAEEALPVLERAGATDEDFRARFLLAKAYEVLGQQAQAVDLLDQVSAHFVAGGDFAGAAQMFTNAGEILDRLDRDGEAAAHFAAAADACQAAGEMPLEEVANRRAAALSWHWAHNMERCMAELSTADTLAAALPEGEPHALWQRSLVSYDGARIFANVGEFTTALERALVAIKGFRELGAAVEATIAEVLRGRLLANLDRRDEAVTVLTAALAEVPEEAEGQREHIQALLTELRHP
ncbi:tetratricopeptide repeat protein [Allokutzneria oryzae]|uniref:Tetratricopeptide repeat protein n=1 Tax=Allokutzneria oryzae TaxID=1378989 RepID=A0ABV6A8A9_9PSEU